jgi:tetratricopeptide (TPR) repeat protein
MALGAGLAVLLALAPGAELSAAAAASPRPSLCRSSGVGLESTLWSRARPLLVTRFCSALARGFAELDSRPAQALALSEAARAEDPAHPVPRLLSGRALFRLGRAKEAWPLLEPFLAPDAVSIDDARSLFDAARAALSVGMLDAAERGYRLLVARSSLLGSVAERRVATIEAASLSLARGPAGIDLALGYLAEARAVPLSGERDLVLALSALALSRSGQKERALAILREANGPWDLEASLSPVERARVASTSLDSPGEVTDVALEPPSRSRIFLIDGELHAAIALLAAAKDSALARAHWKAFLLSPRGQGPWADHARRALAEVGGRRP